MLRIISFLTVLVTISSCIEAPETDSIDLSKYPKTIAGLNKDIWYMKDRTLVHHNINNNQETEYEIPADNFPQRIRWNKDESLLGYVDWDGASNEGGTFHLYNPQSEQTVFTSDRSAVDFRMNNNSNFILLDQAATTWFLIDQNNAEVNVEDFINGEFDTRENDNLVFSPGIFQIEWISQNQIKARVRGTQVDEELIVQQIMADCFFNVGAFPTLTVDEVVIHQAGFLPNEANTHSFKIRSSATTSILEIRENSTGELNILDNGRITDVFFAGNNFLIYNKLDVNSFGEEVLRYYSHNFEQERTNVILPELYHFGQMSVSDDNNFITVMGLSGMSTKWQIFLTTPAATDSAYISNSKFVNSNPQFGPRF